MFEIVNESIHREGARIKVIGVGGAGGNAIQTMMASSLSGVDFIAANTDMQALDKNKADTKIQLGEKLTRGLGAGANPDIGRQAAIESCDALAGELENADMVFIMAGMGGGTGTGAASVIADIARKLGVLTVGVVTRPFSFEGRRRSLHAELGISALKTAVDTLITIPNDRLFKVSDRQTPILNTFRKVDEVLLQAVRGISDLINVHGLINLDFADVRTVMFEKGMAIMGLGEAEGENRVIEAARMAVSSPLVENADMKGARGLIINVTGDSSLSLMEVNEASALLTDLAHQEAEIIFGAVIDEQQKNSVRVTVIATGFVEDLSKSSDNDSSFGIEGKKSGPQSEKSEPNIQYNKESLASPPEEPCSEDKPSKKTSSAVLPRDRLLMKAKSYREADKLPPNLEIREDAKEENQLSMEFAKEKTNQSPFGKHSLIKKSLSFFFDK